VHLADMWAGVYILKKHTLLKNSTPCIGNPSSYFNALKIYGALPLQKGGIYAIVSSLHII
jgi:hypothetical protein